MAKRTFAKLLASLEDQDGVAKVVDATNPEASLDKEVEGTEPVVVKVEGTVQTTDAIDEEMKDYTAIDDQSKKQGEVIHKQLERLTDAESSLEAYVCILRSAVKSGRGIDGGTAAVIAQDLSAQYPKFFKAMTTSLECISMEDDDISDSKEVATTKQAAHEGESKLGKLKGAVVEGWKKFMAWLKERWAKLRGIYEKIFGRTKKVKEANAKLLANPRPETAKEVAAMLGAPVQEGKVEKVEPKEAAAKAPRGKVTVANIGILSGADPLDMKKSNAKVLRDIYENWMKPTEASVKEVLRLMLGDESKSAQMLDMRAIANEIIKVDFEPIKGLLPSNYTIEATDNHWGFKMVQHDQPETITEFDSLDPTAVNTILRTNDDSLDIALEMGEAWVRIVADIAKIQDETKFIMNIGQAADMKKWITEYLTTLTNSDMVPLTKLMVQACTVRLLLCTEMAAPGK